MVARPFADVAGPHITTLPGGFRMEDIDTVRLLRLIPRLAAHPTFGHKLVDLLQCGEFCDIPLTLEDLPTMDIDPDDVDGGEFEELVNHVLDFFFNRVARRVLTVGWDSDFPGGSGAVWVSEYDGIYIAQSSDPCERGPFESLKEMMTEGPFQTQFGNPSIDSDVLSHEVLMELAGRLIVWEDREIVYVNNVAYIPQDGVLAPYREEPDAASGNAPEKA